MTATDEHFDPPLPTPGAVICSGSHYAKARHHPDGSITWWCVRCGMERVMTDGLGWRHP